MNANDTLTDTFTALADPTRRAILLRLAQGEATVNELAQPFKLSLPAVSKHIKMLERGGLVERRRDGQRRPCKLKAQNMKKVVDWMEQYRQFWELSLDRLEAYLQELQAKDPKQQNPNLKPQKKKE